MPENLRSKLVIPVEVPAWAVLTYLIAGAFAFGILYKDLKTVVEAQAKVDLMYERQIKNIEAVTSIREEVRLHTGEIKDLQTRVTVLEGRK